jgi:DNA repair protein RadD
MNNLFIKRLVQPRPLRQRQINALHAYDHARIEGHIRIMMMAPTGFGKTLLSVHLLCRLIEAGMRVAFIVPKIILVDQTLEALAAEGITCVGVMQGEHPATDYSQPVQVCTAQTLARRRTQRFDMYIVDEAHIRSEHVFELMRRFPETPFLGLSATPYTPGLGKHYSKLIIAATTKELIEEGYLSSFKVFAPSPEPDLRGVKTTAGDYNQKQLSEACDKPQLVGDIVATWKRLGDGRPTIVYGVDRAHAEHIQQRFVEAGVSAEYVDCFTEDLDRRSLVRRFKSGQTKVICNVGILTAGFDADVRCIVDAHPTKSEALYVQTIGRGLRTAPGKDHLIVLDHAGNALRLGLVTDIHHEELDDGSEVKVVSRKKEKSEPLPKLCDDCKTVVPHGAKQCPECGATLLRKSMVVARDGELVEFGSGLNGNGPVSIDVKATFFGELKGYAVSRGYERPDGWCAHKYRERFNVWPNDPRVRCAPAREPSISTLNWIRSRAIAFAKAREGQVGARG